MNKNKIIFFLFFYSLIFINKGCLLNAQTINYNFEVNVEYINQASGKHEMNIQLKNISNKDLKILKYDLPWLSISNIVLVAVEAKIPRKLLKQYYEESLPSIDEIIIKKGEIISGRIILSNIFPDLKNTLKKDDVIIFWSYAMGLTPGLSKERYGGYLFIGAHMGSHLE